MNTPARLLVALGGLAVSAIHPAWPQQPVARFTYITKDSIGIQLPDSAYVLVIEHRAGARPVILYPDPELDWGVLTPGNQTLALPIRLLRRDRSVPLPAPQCILTYSSAGTWRADGTLTSRPARKVCGPMPFPGQMEGGYGPWQDWATPHFEFTDLPPYLLLIVFSPSTPPRALTALAGIPNAAPAEVAHRTGFLLSQRLGDAREWQAALWIRP